MGRESRSYRKRSRSRSRSRSPRKRSRSRERRRSRSRDRKRRSKSRERHRSRDRRRSRSRDRTSGRDKKRPLIIELKKKRERTRTPSPPPRPRQVHNEGAILVKDEPLDKEAEQKRLEQEMQKRRERINAWRHERRQGAEEVQLNIALPSAKKWSLEDDDEDDEEDDASVANSNMEDDEVDPLDAYMTGITKEVKSNKKEQSQPTTNQGTNNGEVTQPGSKVTIITATATRRPNKVETKGELMLGNIDAMEYSSEEDEEDLEDTMTRLSKSKKKDLEKVNHDKIYYRSFRKDFYVEVPEISRMTAEEVAAYREQLEGIKVRGKLVPKPIKTWAQCGVSKKVMECLRKHGFERPTPIQAQAIPVVMSGCDMIGIAKTGSGKTLAFLLPMFRHIVDQPEMEEDDGPIAIILTPTRELATQIGRECRKFTKSLNLDVVAVYGGTGISEQISSLKKGAHIIVCTPGRMIDMLTANSGRVTNLRRCTYIVLDEADRMFDMGFEPQVMKIIDNVRPDRQTVMFSATFPRQMEALARRILNKPTEVQVGGRSVVCMEVEQHVVVLEEDNKFLKLLELLGLYQEQGSVLVFVDKQEHADELMKDLLKHSYPCMPLHGGIDQYDRDSTIIDFKASNIKLLIATSIAARGLDVKDLILVINYDCPNHYEDYVHRCGRTGRAGNHGFAYTFMTPDQGRYAFDIIKALTQSGSTVPSEVQNLWDEYKKQAEADGRKIQKNSGFHGKGFKFDETEALMADERKKLQKQAHGFYDEDEGGDEAAVDIDQQIEQMFSSKKRVTDIAKPMISDHKTTAGTQAAPTLGPTNQVKLEMAKKMASKIQAMRKLGPDAQDITQQATLAIMTGGISAPLVSSKTLAEQMAERINAKLGYRPPQEEEKEQDSAGETFKRYEEDLDINEFPQTARWKVTSKEALAQICEYSEAGITVRGTYIEPKKEPKEGERPLYLAIEATNEIAISKAKKEITRLIKEELIRLQKSYQPVSKNRYKVV